MKKAKIVNNTSKDLDSSFVSKIHLPVSFKYYDDFKDTFITFNNVDEDQWNIVCTGDNSIINFSKYPDNLKILLKSVVIKLIKNLSPETAVNYNYAIYNIIENISLIKILQCRPTDLRIAWEFLKLDYISKNKPTLNHCLSFIKQILIYMCEKEISFWSLKELDIIRLQKHYYVDKYLSVKSGECFLSTYEENSIITYLNNQNTNSKTLDTNELIETCLVSLMYQFGFRVKQLSLIRKKDITINFTKDSEIFSLHIQVEKIKQRSSRTMNYLVRKIRSEWQYTFVELLNKTKVCSSENDKLFLNTSRRQIIKKINEVTTKILGIPRGSNSFRHSAAQRMVNAGASIEELKEFLGHTNAESCLVYFANSPEQILRINSALAISNIYSQTSKIAHGDILSTKEIHCLPTSKQISGYPHGFEITGIGGCDLTQKLCPSNPILSCYGCSKFMPVNDISMHKKVEESLKLVVSEFYEYGSIDPYSPTFLQLKQVLNNIQMIIEELRGIKNE